MSADWKAGDRALCVESLEPGLRYFTREHDYFAADGAPVVGIIYMVKCVWIDRRGKPGLILNDKPARDGFMNEVGWDPNCFRKIVPACDRATISEKATP